MDQTTGVADADSPRSNTLDAHWMPFTANRDFKAEPRLIVRSEGVYLWDHHGRRVLDGSSSLFNSSLGHGRPEIVEAVTRQLETNDYTAPFQMGHPGSFALAEALSAILPAPVDHVFFCCSGSEAIDSALKIVMAYHRARGQDRRLRFVARERSYHGVNIGGVSLSGMVKNRESFPVVMPNIVHLRHTWSEDQRFTRGQPSTGREMADDLERFAQLYGGDTIAACFVEPVAGSTGVLVPPVGYLDRLREICDRHGILLVFDEVICGFGRLGAAFGAQAFGVTPDLMTLAKALTNSVIPMGAVAVRDDIYETVTAAAPDGAIELFHGYTYSAHPAACAAALACLKIYRDERIFERAAALTDGFLDAVFSLADHPLVADIRGYGLLAGIELHADGAPGVRGARMQKALFHNGLHVKFTGDAGIVAPPLVAEPGHIDELVAILRRTLDAESHR